MSRKWCRPEGMIAELHEGDVMLRQGSKVADVVMET
jgi:hypothetical protein